MRRFLVILLACLLPLASAGTPDDPEVPDAAGDEGGAGTDPTNSWDIHYGLVQEGGTCGAGHLYFELKLANLVTEDAGAGPGHFKEFNFNIRGEEHQLRGTAVSKEFTLDGEAVGGGLDNTVELYHWCVPFDRIGGVNEGDVIDGLWARTADAAGTKDRAPDADFGRPYVIGQDKAVAVEADILMPTDAVVSLTNGQAVLVFNATNNGTAEDKVTIETNVTSGWNVTVDPGNATIAPGENATFTLTITGNGTGPVTIGVLSDLGFRGSFNITITDAFPSTVNPEPTGNSTDEPDDETEAEGEDSPLPLWAALIGLVILARRRH